MADAIPVEAVSSVSVVNCGDAEATVGLVLDHEKCVAKIYVDPHVARWHAHLDDSRCWMIPREQ